MQLFLDCDGVLADFDKRAEDVLDGDPRGFEDKHGTKEFWDRLYATPDFFYGMDPMPDAYVLFDAVKHLNPIILTGLPRGEWALDQKLRWRDKFFPGVPMIGCPSTKKRDYCTPGDVLVDDWHKYSHLWQQAGGMFIFHHDANYSIDKLKDLNII